jgi:pre-mRNA-splicing factor ATP-dependent RNA helicase DHX15/PRP43
MSELPLEPQLAACLIDSHKYNCSNEMLSVVALLSSPNIFMRPREKAKQADEAKVLFIFFFFFFFFQMSFAGGLCSS